MEKLRPDAEGIATFPLYWLSDLDSQQVRRFTEAWNLLSVNMRRDLMGRMVKEARDEFELDFSAVARIALRDADAEVRRHAIQALWECDDPRLPDIFLRLLLEDPEPSVRAEAAGALGSTVYDCEIDEKPERGAKIEDALIRVFRGADSWEVRRRALEALGYSSRPEIAGLIEMAYHDAEEGMRASALMAMGRSADVVWENEVRAELNSLSPILRAQAAYAAGELSLKRSIGKLTDLLEDVDADVRRQAIRALGEIGGGKAQDALITLKERAGEEDKELIEDALENVEFEEMLSSMGFDFENEADDDEDEEDDEEDDDAEQA
jgi:HEAT repeat protein